MKLVNKLDRYLFRQLCVAMGIITITLIFVIWLSRSMKFIDYIVNRGVSFSTFMYLTSLLLPSLLYVILPITLFTAVVFTYNRIAHDSELVVSYASGISPTGISKAAFMLCGLVILISYFFSLYLIPTSYRNFKDLQYEIRNDFSLSLLEEGVFSTINDQLTVYIRERDKRGELHGILVHDTKDPARPVTIIAERGAIVDTDTGPRILVVKGHRQERVEKDNKLNLLYFDEYTLDLNQTTSPAGARWREPRERYLGELLFPDEAGNDQRFRTELIAKGHARILTPLYNLGYVLVALYVLLMGEFSRRGQALRITTCVGVVVVWQALSLGVENMATKNNTYILVMYILALLPTLLLGYLFFFAQHAAPYLDAINRKLGGLGPNQNNGAASRMFHAPYRSISGANIFPG